MLQDLAVDSKARQVKQSPTYYILDIVKSFFQSINIIKLSSGKNETLVSWTIIEFVLDTDVRDSRYRARVETGEWRMNENPLPHN